MSAAQARVVLLANAAFDVALGVLLLTGTWDGLWDALDLPQGQPALFVQVGGAALLGLAYLLWRAADERPLRGPVALSAAVAEGLAAAVVLVWLLTGELPDDVDALGTILLIALVVVLGVFTLLKVRIVRERPAQKTEQELRRSP
jgi:hypothetical protein